MIVVSPRSAVELDSTSHGSIVQSVQSGEIIDVGVGVGSLLLEILIAGDDLGEVDGGRGEGKPEAEAEDDRCFGEHGVYGGDIER